MADYKTKKVPTFVPNPIDIDYKRGYIKRYFIQKSNDDFAPIYEVSVDVFSSYNSNPFYKTVILDWRLIGNAEEISNSNFKSLKLASNKIKSIQSRLLNLLQFSKQ